MKREKKKMDIIMTRWAPYCIPGSAFCHIKDGDTVAEGSEIAVVEAMKMQNVLKAHPDLED
jgi:propionyl-CoA carboxylase alpha chain